MSAALDAARAALREERVWLVGGAVRDRLLHRPTDDVDLVVEGDVRTAARHLGLAVGGPAFPLSEAFGAWRVIGPGRAWQVDLSPLHGSVIEEDLARRDFTINAIAEPLAGGALVDPHGGAADAAHRRLRMVSAAAFDEDPLRVLRLARLVCELGLHAEPATLRAAQACAPRIADVAPERVFAEMRRIVATDEAVAGLGLADELGVTGHVIPELEALRGVDQSAYHDKDVHGHTLAVLEETIALEQDPASHLGDAHATRIRGFLAEPLADEMTRGTALRLGALLHDIAKPETQVVRDGVVRGFPRHDERGAAAAREILTRLRTSERLRTHVAALARHHLRLGYLVHSAPLGARDVHAYLAATDPVSLDVTLLSVADRLATRGRKSEEAIAAHLALAREILPAVVDWQLEPRPAPLVRGDVLASALGIRPGPVLGEILAELEAARYAGEVDSADAAIDHARRWLADRDG